MRSCEPFPHNLIVISPCRGLDKADPVSLPSLLEVLGEDRLVIADSFKEESLIDDAPLVFPLLSAIRSGKGTGLAANLPRSLSEWGARALLERAGTADTIQGWII